MNEPNIEISNLGLDDLDISVSDPVDFGQDFVVYYNTGSTASFTKLFKLVKE